MIGLDRLGRILIPEDFREKFVQKEVHVYYSEEEKKFFILPNRDDNHYWLAKRLVDEKGRFCLPKEILKFHETGKLMLLQKNGLIYVVPLKDE